MIILQSLGLSGVIWPFIKLLVFKVICMALCQLASSVCDHDFYFYCKCTDGANFFWFFSISLKRPCVKSFQRTHLLRRTKNCFLSFPPPFISNNTHTYFSRWMSLKIVQIKKGSLSDVFIFWSKLFRNLRWNKTA